MADRYIALQNGRLVSKAATTASTGAAEAGRVVALDSNGKLSATLFPTGIGDDVLSIVASEGLAAGAVVNVWDDAGTPKVRNADATVAGKEANGFVLAAFTAGQAASVYSDGTITGLTGLTPGARYYLSMTPGQITTAPPSAAGNVVQYLGTTHTATSLPFEPSDGVILE